MTIFSHLHPIRQCKLNTFSAGSKHIHYTPSVQFSGSDLMACRKLQLETENLWSHFVIRGFGSDMVQLVSAYIAPSVQSL